MESKISIKNKIQSYQGFKIAPFRKNIRKTAPHRHHSYYEIIYLSEGIGTHTIDNITYDILPNTIFIVRQEQVHFWDIHSEPEGFVILIKRPLVDQSIDSDLKQIFSNLSSKTHAITKSPKYLEDLFGILLNEHQSTAPNKIIIEGLLKALLYKISESNFSSTTINNSLNNSQFQKFISAIPQNIQQNHQVKFFAELLHTTPQNLNSICQKESEKTASTIISDFLITEAKRLLIYTDNPVIEIAHDLGFSDASNFVKFFKRHTTSTPNTFRKQPQ